MADATQMRQVVMNLITNASEAIGEISGVVTLSTGVMDCDEEYLQGVVGDLWVRATVRTARCAVDPFNPGAGSPETPTELPGRLDCPGAPIRRALVLHDSMMAAMLPICTTGACGFFSTISS